MSQPALEILTLSIQDNICTLQRFLCADVFHIEGFHVRNNQNKSYIFQYNSFFLKNICEQTFVMYFCFYMFKDSTGCNRTLGIES